MTPLPLEQIVSEIQRAVPSATTSIARDPEGSWWLDVRRDERMVRIEWSPKRGGFGVSEASDDDDSFGLGPDAVFDTPLAAAARAIELLDSSFWLDDSSPEIAT